MFTVLATRLALKIVDPATTALEYSQAVSVEGDNGVTFDFTVYNMNGTGLDIKAQFSSDLENWTDGPTTINATTPGYFTSATAGAAENAIGYQYARLEYRLSGADANFAILASGITTSNQ